MFLTHTYDYCDKNLKTKDPKGRNERIVRRKARQDKKGGGSNSKYSKESDVDKLKATVEAQKKLLAINESQRKAVEIEIASKIIFDEDKDLIVQAAALSFS